MSDTNALSALLFDTDDDPTLPDDLDRRFAEFRGEVTAAPAFQGPPGNRAARPGTEPDGHPPHVRLKDVLHSIPIGARHGFLTEYHAALRRGVVRAVELTNERFSVRWRADGRPARVTLKDELIEHSARFRVWLEERRKEADYAQRAVDGRLGTTLAALASGEDDFDRLATLRRQQLLNETAACE